jgi:pyruvate dehydrogenase E2 component (dihydrolipoamide acetyltransferase)
MIRYLELTAPEKSEFRQAKILSVEVSEGSEVKQGDPLFIVQSGKNEIPLPSKLDGKVTELIADVGDNISILTPLLLLETIVDDNKESSSNKTDSQAEPEDAEKVEAETKETTSTTESSIGETTNNKEQNKPKSAPRKKSSISSKLQDASGQLDLIEPKPNETTHLNTNKNETQAMSDTKEVQIIVPDIGGDNAQVTEILVSVGDTIELDDSIVTLESDKAGMDVPATHAGTVTAIHINLDDEVSEGSKLVTVSVQNDGSSAADVESEQAASQLDALDEEPTTQGPSGQDTSQAETKQGSKEIIDVTVPDIGGDSAKVIEIHVSVGDSIEIDGEILTLESDKASMDVPSTHAGTVKEILVSVDDSVEEGSAIIRLETVSTQAETASQAPEPTGTKPTKTAEQASAAPQTSAQATAKAATASPSPTPPSINQASKQTIGKSHATPSIRKLARELGVDLSRVTGTGRKGRVSADDLKAYVKGILSGSTGASVGAGSGIPAIPDVDFSKFGKTENFELNKIKRLTAQNLHRAWVNVPHVTHHDEANARQIETLRKGLKEEYAAQGVKISPLAFIIKACVAALKEFPTFNSSLHSTGEHLILKHYYNIGIAVDTPNGLVVPVIKDADTKSIKDISIDLADLSSRARDKKLTPKDLQGATFSISSLGGIGGRFFTPIVNAPEVAILGVSRTKISPEWDGEQFVPTPMLPLSLSYDHRVIDGAEAARFSAFVTEYIKTFNLD